jgi:hypothetical protein
MSQPNEGDARRSNRRKLFPALFCLFFGLMPTFNAIGNPRLEAMRWSDVAQLIAIGLCFGAAFALLVGYLMGNRAS